VTTDKKFLAHVAISALFFTSPCIILLIFLPVNSIHLDFLSFSFNYFAVVPIVLGIISLCGCIVSMSLDKKQSPYWYWGIPLCIATAVVTIVSLLFLMGISFIGWNALQSFILLTPCAALFFYSEKKVNGSGMGLVIISIVISVLPAILLYGLIFPQQYAPLEHVFMSPFEVLFWVYYLLGLPIVGALFLTRAFGFPREGGTHLGQ
jgi:heme/copper-type cytochrome/quinol oxidase subunit 2